MSNPNKTKLSKTEPYLIRFEHRGLIVVKGEDRHHFLQGLVTNDVLSLPEQGIIWSALLSPQGKFQHEFFVIEDEENQRILIDCAGGDALMSLGKTLRHYVLEEQVKLTIEQNLNSYTLFDPNGKVITDEQCNEVMQKYEIKPSLKFNDPRTRGLGWRLYANDKIDLLQDNQDLMHQAYHALRITHAIPDQNYDLSPEFSGRKPLLLELNFDQFGGIAWDKGCYMGQELTARTKYRALLKRRLYPISAPSGTLTPDQSLIQKEKTAGTVYGICDHPNQDQTLALAMLNLPAVEAWSHDQTPITTDQGGVITLLPLFPWNTQL